MTENNNLKAEYNNAVTENNNLKAEYDNAMTENNNLKFRMDFLEAELATIRNSTAVSPDPDNDL
jgi:hypothetical protein